MGICLDYAIWSTALCNQKGVFILHILKNLIVCIGCIFILGGCGRQVSYVSQNAETGLGVNALTTGENHVDESETTQMQEDSGEESSVDETQERTEQPAMVAVYVCGAVKNAGVYYVSPEAIKETAVRMAGGFDEHADVNYVNLAEPVTAGEQIYIPTEDETAEIAFPQGGQADSPEGTNHPAEALEDSRININTAGKEELMTLPGIGENKADAIIAYREAQGKFQSTEELMNISGIKEGVYNKIKDLIIVG